MKLVPTTYVISALTVTNLFTLIFTIVVPFQSFLVQMMAAHLEFPLAALSVFSDISLPWLVVIFGAVVAHSRNIVI